MQVRLRNSNVLTRILPIANATHMGEHPPWQFASADCVAAWIQSNAAVWRWLVAQGIDVEAAKLPLNEAMFPGHKAISI